MASAPRTYACAVAQLPPPVTGLSTVSAAAVAALSRRLPDLAIVNIAPAPHARGLGRRLSRLWPVGRALMALARAPRGAARVCYMPADGGVGLYLNLVVALAARRLGYQLITHHHSFAYITRRDPGMAWLTRALGPRAVHVFLCQGMRDRFMSRYGDALRAHVAPNDYVFEPPSPATGKDAQGPLTLGHLSNLSLEKGVGRFMDLFEALVARGVNVRAVAAGPAAEAPIAARLRALEGRHPGRFQWLGPVYGADKAAFFDQIDAFVFPSTYANEAQPLVLIEALRAGAPILAINAGCIGCDYGGEGVGLVCDDPGGFAPRAGAWIERAAAEPQFLAGQRRAALNLAAQRHAAARQALEDLLETVLEGEASGAQTLHG